MNDHLTDIDLALEAIFARHAGRDARLAAGGSLLTPAWQVLEDHGMTTIGAAENEVGLPELAVVARATGRAAAAVPLVEMAGLAVPLVTGSGVALPEGILTIAAHPSDRVFVEPEAGGWRVRATLARVPWGRHAESVAAITVVGGVEQVVLVPVDHVDLGTNLAGEPRDTVHADSVVPRDAVAVSAVPLTTLRHRGAVLRAASMVGAMEAARDLTLDHAGTREQFGRPIAAFQAVQHHLVAVASETLCAAMAVDLAVAAAPDQLGFAAAAAKAVAGRAAAVVTRSAHQVLAAIGVTDEHSLPWFTTRLWSWQDEFGSSAHWAHDLGRAVTGEDSSQLWPTISQTIGGRAGALVAVTS